MGNHSVGRAFSAAAKGFIKIRKGAEISKEEALAFLDGVGEEFRGADAEFDDEFCDDTPLKKLVGIAFDATPEEIADVETDYCSPFYEGPYTRFRTRYNFC